MILIFCKLGRKDNFSFFILGKKSTIMENFSFFTHLIFEKKGEQNIVLSCEVGK
jgi:hypothetical protein